MALITTPHIATTENALRYSLTFGAFESITANTGGGSGDYIEIQAVKKDFDLSEGNSGGDFATIANYSYTVTLTCRKTSIANTILGTIRQTLINGGLPLPLTVNALPTADRPTMVPILVGQAVIDGQPSYTVKRGAIDDRQWVFMVTNVITDNFVGNGIV